MPLPLAALILAAVPRRGATTACDPVLGGAGCAGEGHRQVALDASGQPRFTGHSINLHDRAGFAFDLIKRWITGTAHRAESKPEMSCWR